MSTSGQAIDLGFDLRAERSRRLRRAMRIAVPVVTLVVLLAVIGGIGTYLYKANRKDARLLTDDLLAALERRIVSQVVTFLEPASIMVHVADKVLKGGALHEQAEDLAEPLAMQLLESTPQLATFSFADPQGNFLMVKRMPDGSIATKSMDRRGDGVETRWVRRDEKGNIVEATRDPSDTYDPRTRPWYLGAVAEGGLYWSDVYVFYTDQRPGVTASLPIFDADGRFAAVYSIDISLEKLSAFLASLEIGNRGRAMIIDEHGVFVAYPEMERVVKKTDGGLERAHLEELEDPVLNRAFDRFRVDGPGTRELVVDGHVYISTATSLKATLGRDWTLLIVAPEEDFVGFVAENNRQGLYMSAAVLALASLLAGLLIVQGLRADRNAQLVFERRKQLEAQSRAFSGLASQAALFDSSDASAVGALTEIVARTVSTRRISVWHLSIDGQRLVCEDAFDKETGRHTGAMALTLDEMPQLFEPLERGDEIVVIDAAADPRTAELHRIYLHPLGCRAVASIPVISGERTVGAVWLEDDADGITQASGDIDFARAVANMLALRMSGEEPGEGSRGRGAAARDATRRGNDIAETMRKTQLVAGNRADVFLARIARQRNEGAAIGAQVFEDVTVVVIRFTDPVSLATAVSSVVGDDDDLVDRLDTLASELGAQYLKLLGDQIVCAAGFDADPQASAEIMAEIALGAMDHCARLFARLERTLDFRIGIDSGPVIGSAVGRDRSLFNLWGEAVLTASRMAETGISGQIQATESTYRHLREDFLFRARGSYYLEGFGEFTTYMLSGRL